MTTEESALPVVSGAGAPKRKLLVPLLIGGLVFAVALATTFAVLWAQSRDTTADEVEAFLGAEEAVVADRATELIDLLMNYDSTNLEDVSAEVLTLSTGDFAEDYEDILAGGLSSALEQSTASSRGQILDGPDVFFESPSEATALLRVEQTTQSNDNPGGQSFTYVMQLSLVDTTSEGWKADRVEILSQQTS
jgi:lipopolysaccharide export LptBFGC system permease protein LptF